MILKDNLMHMEIDILYLISIIMSGPDTAVAQPQSDDTNVPDSENDASNNEVNNNIREILTEAIFIFMCKRI